ncbi:hypothetical protein ABDD95_20825 [Mucilaginibacter sp. PAMB04274]|uniref:hypothetical protein n=1 Tax=Mucilaginibacter sp. PAMB04274 TaxID=3138568 RepID=UPI0031F621AC
MSGKDIYHKYLGFARQARTLLKRFEEYCRLDPVPDLTFSLHVYHHNLNFVFIKTIAVVAEMHDKNPMCEHNDEDITWPYSRALQNLTLAEAIYFYETYADHIIAVYDQAFDHRLFELDFRYLDTHIERLRFRLSKIENYLLPKINLPMSIYRNL